MIYEIGRLRVWYEGDEVQFEIVDGNKRLNAFIYALSEEPYLLQVLIDIFVNRLIDYEEELERKHKELSDMVETLTQKIDDKSMKWSKEYIEELKKKREGIEKRIERINNAVEFIPKLREKLLTLRTDLSVFLGIVEKVWVGREW